jgi:hypothetical protein
MVGDDQEAGVGAAGHLVEQVAEAGHVGRRYSAASSEMINSK